MECMAIWARRKSLQQIHNAAKSERRQPGASIINRLRFLAWLHRAGRNSILPREVQHETVESLSGKLSNGYWNGGDGSACSLDQTGEPNSPNQSTTVGCS